MAPTGVQTMTWEELKQTVNEISFRDWKFELGYMGGFMDPPPTEPHLRVKFLARDAEGEETRPYYGRWWRLSYHMVKGEIVQTALKAVLTALEHEAREEFLYRDRAVFGPHLDIDALWEIADRTVVRS